MTDYKYVYGPVPSRRMGLSVGISPIPKGYCNYSCIYCQLGRTSHMTNKRENFFKQEDIVEEFKDYISKGTHFDVVTIVGEGEPSLYLDLGILIEKLKELTDKPLAVITNGALLSDAGVRKNLKAADIILPSLDASNEEIFKKINRPHKNINFDSLLQGLETFSQDYKGELWLELMILRDINDSKEFFLDYKKLVEKINYHKLYINSPV
ncbi:MAG TPA: radical SAM protein, partial [Clostridia bacterium]|nr:radical SAM protein [Clostridia bacterium]